MEKTPQTTPRKSATFDDYTLSEISKARNDESAGNALLYIPSGFYDLLKKYA